jgi:ATP-binding cassette subfamily B protein
MMVIHNQITLGQFVAFNGYLGLVIWPMRAIGFVINILQRGSASLARINDVMAVRPEIVDIPELVKPVASLKGDIRVCHLTFHYPGSPRPAIQDVSFHLKAGQTLGIVGRTGSGKSTLANLLVRLYEAAPETILVDGLPLTAIPLQTLRKAVGYVPQEQFLFSQTIRENIAFGKDGASDEEIIEAARAAHILHDILAFPKQWDTLVGERGITLSGGQKQRIAIARALISNPPILILDDSLSAVDTKTEEAILAHMAGVRKGRTTLIIAHRISSIKNADHILVLDQGKVIAAGTHQQLLAEQGLYADLYRQQLLERQFEEKGGEPDVRAKR